MNQTISTFMKIAITVAAIGLLLFGAAYTMSSGEATQYKNRVDSELNWFSNTGPGKDL